MSSRALARAAMALALLLGAAVAPRAAEAQGAAMGHAIDDREGEPATAPRLGPGVMQRFGRGKLLDQLRNGGEQEQIDAAREFGRRRDREAVPAMLELLSVMPPDSGAILAEAMIQALGRIGDRRAVPFLLGQLNARGPLQRAAVEALGRIGDERALDPIAELLSRPSLSHDATTALLALGPRVLMRAVSLLRDPASAGVACELLGRLGDRRALWPMVRALGSPRARVRRECAAALGELGDPRAQRALYGMLQDPDASVRRWALASLASLADGSMGPALAPLLDDVERGAKVIPALRGEAARAAVPSLAKLAAGPPGPEQDEAVAALGRIGDAEAVSALGELLRAPRADVRFQAASSLARVGEGRGLEPLLAAARATGPEKIEGLRGLGDLLRPVPMIDDGPPVPEEARRLARAAMSDASPEVAGAGAFLAGALRDDRALPALAALARARPEPELRALAVTALGWLGTGRACPAALEALGDRHEGVRASAALVAGELGCRDAGPRLLVALEQGTDVAAGNAAWALGAVAYREAAAPLRQRLSEGGPAVRANTALALAALGDQRAGPLIRGRVEREPSPHVKAALVDALGRLGGQRSLALLERLDAQALPGLAGVLARDGAVALRAGRTLHAPRGSAVFRTRLVDSRGEPLPGITYTLALPDRRIVSGLSDPSGEITVAALPDGPCVLGLGRSP